MHNLLKLRPKSPQRPSLEKISDIVESIAHEKSLPIEDVRERVCEAIVSSLKRTYNEHYDFFVDEAFSVFQRIAVVADDDEEALQYKERAISLSKAKEEVIDIEVGDELSYEIELKDMSRTTVALMFRELEYRLQSLMEEKIQEKYQSKVGTVIYGPVTRVDSEECTFIELEDNIRAKMPRKNRIKGEVFKPGDTIRALIRRVLVDKHTGIYVELSRTAPKFLEALIASEVPEVKEGSVSIMASARIPGERAKILVKAERAGIDPVGACVGLRGMRVNAVSNELNGESIDCIEYSPQPEVVITRALAPAVISSVKIVHAEEGSKDATGRVIKGKAIVNLSDEQRNRAIGKSGINIRLAGMLSGFDVELMGSSESKDSEQGLAQLKELFGE